MTTVLMRSNCGTNITVFSRLQNDAAVKVDNFVSDGRVFHNDGPATEKLRV